MEKTETQGCGRRASRVLRHAVRVACSLVIAMAGLQGCGSRSAAQEGQRPDPPAAPPGMFRVTAQQAANLAIRPVALHGFRGELVTEGRIALDGDRQTQVFSPWSGRVIRILAAPGDRVRAGAPLAELEAGESVQAQADLQAAAAAARSADSQLALARGNEERRHALYDAHVGALQDWEQARNDLALAGNASQSATTALALARNRLRIQGMAADAIAAVEGGRTVDARTTVTAPIGGVVTDRQVGPGQFVQAGASTPLFAIGDLSRVWLVGNVREAQARDLRPGQEVSVQVPAWPQRSFHARLSWIAPAVDPATHRLAVRAELANPDGALRPEMFATFTIATSAEVQVLAVPESAVVLEADKARVWVEDSPGVLQVRDIRPGRAMRGMVEVLGGLRAGERVVTSGTLFIDRAGNGD